MSTLARTVDRTARRRRVLATFLAALAMLITSFVAYAPPATAAPDTDAFYWTNATGDGKWSTPGNWVHLEEWTLAEDWASDDVTDPVATRAPGSDPAGHSDSVTISSNPLGEAVAINVDMPHPVNVGLALRGDVSLGGAGSINVVSGAVSVGAALDSDGDVTGSDLAIQIPLKNFDNPDDSWDDDAFVVLYSESEETGADGVSVTVSGAALSDKTDLVLDGTWGALHLNERCPWVTVADSRGWGAFSSEHADAYGARVGIVGENTVGTIEVCGQTVGYPNPSPDGSPTPTPTPSPTPTPTPTNPTEPGGGSGSNEPVASKPEDLAAVREGSSTLLTWKPARVYDGSALRGYRVFRYTERSPNGALVESTKEQLADVTARGKVTLWGDTVVAAGAEEDATTFSVSDVASFRGTDFDYDPNATYFYTVQAYTATGTGVVSDPVSPDLATDGRMSIKVAPRTEPRPGMTVPIDARISNGTTYAYGAVTFTLNLPNTTLQQLPVDLDSLPNGGSDDNGWSCTAAEIYNLSTLVNCANSTALGAGGVYPRLSVAVKVPKNASRTSFAVNYSASTAVTVAGGGKRTIQMASKSAVNFIVAEAQRSYLAAEVGVPTTLPMGPVDDLDSSEEENWEPLTVRVKNEGKAATTAPVTVTLPLAMPYDLVDQRKRVKAGGIFFNPDSESVRTLEGWRCSREIADPTTTENGAGQTVKEYSTFTVTCVSREPVLAGSSTPDLVLPIAATSVRGGNKAYNFMATVGSEDFFGPVSTQAQASAKLPATVLPALSPSSTHYDPAAWTSTDPLTPMDKTRNVTLPADPKTASVKESAILGLAATNAGQTPFSGKLTFVATVPMASLVRSVGAGWACERDGVSLTCVKDDVETAAGAVVHGPTLVVSPITSAPIHAAAAFAGSLHTVTADLYGLDVSSPPVTTDLSTPAGVVSPPVSTMATLKSAPLTAGFATDMTFALQGHPTMGDSEPRILVALFPSQVAVDSDAPEVELSGYGANAADPTCRTHRESVPGGFATAILCLADQTVPAESQVDVTVGLTVGAGVVGALKFPVGAIAPRGDSVSESLDRAWSTVKAQGAAAMQSISTLAAESLAINASAGAAQEVDAATPQEDGSQLPTRVSLDASATVPLGRPLTYTWTQTSGPAVTWLANNDGTAAGTGQRPAFTAPSVTSATTLSFAVVAQDSGGPATGRATTTVTVRPAAPIAPQVTSVTAYGPDGQTELDPTVAPAPGSRVWFAIAYRDPSGNPVTASASVTTPKELSGLRPGWDRTERSGNTGVIWMYATWTSSTPYMVFSFRVTGSRNAAGLAASTTSDLAVGKVGPALGVSIEAPTTPVRPGTEVQLSAVLTNPDFNGSSATVQWEQTGGPEASVTSVNHDGTAGRARIPASAQVGDTITIRVIGRRGFLGATASVATAVLVVGAPEPMEVSTIRATKAKVEGDLDEGELVEGNNAWLTIDIEGGIAPYDVTWETIIGEQTLDNHYYLSGGQREGTAAVRVPNLQLGVGAYQATVVDAVGQTATQVTTIEVGERTLYPSEIACADDGPVGMVLKAARDFAADSATSNKRVVISYGDAVIDFGPASLVASWIPAGSCSAAFWRMDFSGASITYRGIGLTGVAGAIQHDRLAIYRGRATLPASWHLDEVYVETLELAFDERELSGSLTAYDIPILSAGGSTFGTLRSTFTFGPDALSVSASASQNGGSGEVTITGAYCWQEEDCEDIEPFETVAADELAINVTGTGLEAFGATFAGSGTLLTEDDEITGEVEFGLDGGTVELGVADTEITAASMTWNAEALEFELGATVASQVDVTIAGVYADSKNWSAAITGGLASDWTLAPGLTLAGYDEEAETGTTVEGTLAKSTTGSKTTTSMTMALQASGMSWTVGPVKVTDLAFQLGQGAVAPASCALSSEEKAGVYATVSGLSKVTVGSTSVDVGADFCVVPGVKWRAVTKASAPAFSPVPGLNLTGVSLAAEHTTSPAATTMSLAATGSALGVSGAAVVALDSTKTGTDVAASLTVNLNDVASVLGGTGRIIYTSKPIADLSESVLDTGLGAVAKSAKSCRDTSSVASLEGVGVKAGFTAIGQFQLGADACEMLSQKLDFPAATNVSALVNLGSGSPTVSLTLSMGEDGVTIFRKSDGTRLTLNSASLVLSADRSLSITGNSSLFVPRPDVKNSTQLARLDAVAGVKLSLSPVMSLTAALTIESENWTDALGITGLTLTQAAIQVGVTFAALPIPSVGIAATAADVPASWKRSLGIVGTETMGFALNVSLDHPIVSITLGEADGEIFMKPLKPVDERLADSLQIDAASLTLAPFGGTIGTIVFPAGISFSFDAVVLGVGVHFDASVSMDEPAMSANAKVGAFTVGPLALDETTVRFALDSDGLEFRFQGGFTLNSNPLSTASAGAARASATVDLTAATDGSFTLAFDAQARGLSIGGVATIDNLMLSAEMELPSGEDAVTANFVLAGLGQVSVLGKQFTLGGAIVYSSGALQSFDAIAASDPFDLGPVSVGGNGCSAEAVETLPESLRQGGKLQLPTSGPCLQVGVHPGSATPFRLYISAALAVSGLSVELQGGINSSGIAIDTARVQLTDAVEAKLYNSKFFYASNGQPDGYLKSPTGSSHRVSNGDFRLQGTVAVKLAGFVEGDLDVDIGRISGVALWAKGSLAVGLLQSEASPIHANVRLTGDFSKVGSTYNWSLGGNADLLLGGTKTANGWADAYRVAGARFLLNNSGFSASGSLSAGPVSGDVEVDFAWVNGLAFRVAGTARIQMLGVGVDATVSVSNRTSQGLGVIVANAAVDAQIGSFVRANVSGTFTSTGAMCLAGRGSINVPVGNSAPNLANITASVCTPGTGAAAGFKANASAFNGMINLGINITDANGFLVYGVASIPGLSVGDTWCGWLDDCWGARAWVRGSLMLAISSSDRTFSTAGRTWSVNKGVSLKGEAALGAEICVWDCWGGEIGVSIAFNPIQFCVNAAGSDICYRPPSSLWIS